MNRKQPFVWVSLLFMFFLTYGRLKAQEPVMLDSKMKPGKSNDMRIEELKVRWKKAALENCQGVPCVTAPTGPSSTCGTSTVTDVDGNVYNTVNVGTQVWTRENLKVTKYNDGVTPIPIETNNTTNTNWRSLSTGARTEYVAAGVTGTDYVTTYGYLYNWYAVAGIVTPMGSPTKNICPSGWHVPTDADWTTLIRFLDINEITILNGTQSLIAGGKIKEKGTINWGVESPGTDNSSCFTALPGGKRNTSAFTSGFSDRRWYAYFWSSTENPSVNTEALNRELCDSCDGVSRYTSFKEMGYSVRCVKD